MAKVCWPYFDPEYENFSNRMNPPRFTKLFSGITSSLLNGQQIK